MSSTLNEMPAAQQRLTPLQASFVEHYLSPDCLYNATEAARRAGYAGNDNTLGTVGYENMQKPAVRAAIERRLQEVVNQNQLTINKVICDVEMTRISAIAAGNHSVALRCSELQGKYLGMWDAKRDGGKFLEDLSTEELVELAGVIYRRGHVDLRSAFFPNE